MKLFWVFLCLPLINGVSVSKSEVDKQVRSKRTTPNEYITALDNSEDHEKEDEEEDKKEGKENNSDEEKEEPGKTPDLTSEEVAYLTKYLGDVLNNPQHSSHRLIEPPRGNNVRRDKQYSGFKRDSFASHSGFRGHHSRHFKSDRRNRGEYNGGSRGSERDDSHYRRRSNRRYGDNNDRDRDYHKHRRGGHGYGGSGHGGYWRTDKKKDRHESGWILTSELTGPNGVKVNITDPQYSKEWHCPDTATLMLLQPDHWREKEEYGMVKDLVEKAWAGSFGGSIQKVEKITNQCLWKKYRYRKTQITNDWGQKDVIETLLFYGAPAADLTAKTDEGFDERDLTLKSSDNGAAFDFTSSSSKADTKATANAAGSKTMLLCRVALGNAQTVTSATRLAHAPIGFHSVKQGDQYAIYRGEQVYPEYLITYT